MIKNYRNIPNKCYLKNVKSVRAPILFKTIQLIKLKRTFFKQYLCSYLIFSYLYNDAIDFGCICTNLM